MTNKGSMHGHPHMAEDPRHSPGLRRPGHSQPQPRSKAALITDRHGEHSIYHTSGCGSKLCPAHNRLRIRHIHHDRTTLSDAVICRGSHSFRAAFADLCYSGNDQVCEVCDMETTSSYCRSIRNILIYSYLSAGQD